MGRDFPGIWVLKFGMNQTIVIGVAALFAGAAGGFLIGRSDGEGDSGVRNGDEVAPPAKIRRDGPESDRDRAARSGGKGFDEIMREPGQSARLQALIDLYAGMDPAQLEAEAEKLDGLPMGDRILASVLLFSRWAEVDPQGAMTYANGMGFGGMFAKPTILRSWASVDPVNAAKYYTENPNEFGGMGRGRGPRGDAGAEIVAREWAKLDPTAAMQWAEGLEGSERVDAMVSVIGEVAATDPAKAATMAAGLEGSDQAQAYGEIAERWARDDFEAADAWASTLSGEARDRAMREVIEVLADSDPAAAAARISTLSDPGQRDRAIERVAGEWSQQDPAGAAEWLITQETNEGDDAMRRVMGNWVAQDSAGALSFIEEQPAGDIRDGAAQTYLWMNRDMAPTEAITLAESITDENSRLRSIGMTARRWMEEDEAAARAYVESNTALDDRMKERILDGDGGRRGR